MKICWDTIVNIILRKDGRFFDTSKGRAFDVKVCITCNEDYLSMRKDDMFCSPVCRSNHPDHLAILKSRSGVLSPRYGQQHSIESKRKMHESLKGRPAHNKGIPCKEETKEKIRLAHFNGGHEYVLYEDYKEKFIGIEEIQCDPGGVALQVKCTYCDRWFTPNTYSVRHRLAYILRGLGTEHRFYCTDGCKKSCPIFRQRVWPSGYKVSSSREVQPSLRKMVLKRDGYECTKCHRTEELHCHHIDPVIQNPIESADVDNCITLCKNCHILIHKQPGCGYNDLKCKESYV